MKTSHEHPGKGLWEHAARFAAYVLILTLCLPAPVALTPARASAADEITQENAHILRRLNSPERQAAIEEMTRIDATAREAHAQSQAAVAPAASAPRRETRQSPASASGGNVAPAASTAASRPKTVTEVLFNYATGFAGVPGLAPQRGSDGSFDEGLGFHQDGTARKAGGVTGAIGPSEGGRRASAYMRSALPGLQGESGLYGAGPGYDPLIGRYDPTHGGRRSGNGQTRDFSNFDPLRMAQDRALSWGLGALNSAGEAALSGLMDNGRARLNFTIDWDGHFQGEGDVLLPFYDGQYTTVFTQLGARSMAVSGGEADGQDRWIGNFGLGQRWFPNATEEDSGNWMIGYNVFFDNDFTRSHQRGGVGMEAQYDWLRLASNYYFPLSGWKGSYDFDSRFIEERPARGWDARLKAFLPFYRNVALTGAYTQWYGDHVGMFGHRNLEKDPKVWSYGLEYTPVPLVSGFLTQRSTERGRTDTEFGLNFTYHFGMPFEDQVQHSKVAEMRTVSGSRHEFVDRENRIILEYRAKNSYRIEYLGQVAANTFRFRVLNGFDEYMAGQTVHVTASGAYLAEASPAPPASLFARAVNFLDGLISVTAAYAADPRKSYRTNQRGEFDIVLAGASGPVPVTIRAGDNEQTFTLNGSASSLISIIASTDGGNFTSGNLYSTASLTAKVTDASGNPVNGATVTWTVLTAQNNSPAMMSGWGNKKTGLTWGNVPESGNGGYTYVYQRLQEERIVSATNNTTTTAPNGETVMQLTDIVGERVITVQAKVNIGGTDYTATQAVSFGNGPLYVFRAPLGTSSPYLTWDEAYQACNGSVYPNGSDHTTGWTSGTYVGGGKMPTRVEYQAVSPIDTAWGHTNPNSNAQGAAVAAGWPDNRYWSGEAFGADIAFHVLVFDGYDNGGLVGLHFPVACRR
ncbi:MAG: inverse autotransporter beta domain-containing protein [Desulfovibrio sp.]|jgi:hypothetical protein|nr:inverse autotransporter beta domain-containing protein [Desulfovibrio sp.]